MLRLYVMGHYDVHMPRKRKSATRRSPKKTQRRGSLAARVLRIGKDSAARLEESLKAMDPDKLLYDESGLPH